MVFLGGGSPAGLGVCRLPRFLKGHLSGGGAEAMAAPGTAVVAGAAMVVTVAGGRWQRGAMAIGGRWQ